MKLLMGVTLVLGLVINQASGFALLGPYAEWMDAAKSYRVPGNIGGPMNINEDYRWNVPVVTYGFERSFLDYFGTNGVAAVEAAVQMINELPFASQINLTNFPLNAWHFNHKAQALNLMDLKSAALSALLEQMGLARPQPNVFCVRAFVGGPGSYIFSVVQRNFDPATAQPSSYVNDTLFDYMVVQLTAAPTNGVFCDADEYPVDPLALTRTAVADFTSEAGSYAARLSRDDTGGLRFLWSGSQVRHEDLLPDVQALGGGSLVRSALRAGIEKVTLICQPNAAQGPGFKPVTNRWTDIYYFAGIPGYQQVERIATQPDILFSARDLGPFLLLDRTGTTNWINHAEQNGNPGGAGPGVIRSPVTIAFNNIGRVYYSAPMTGGAMASAGFVWASYDGSTNAPIVFPAPQVGFQPSQIRLRVAIGRAANQFEWTLSGPAHGRFQFQSATNLSQWQTLTTLTNSGAAFMLDYTASKGEARRFFRIVPE